MGPQGPPALRYFRLVAVTSLRAGPSCGLPGQAPEQRDWVKIQSAKSSKVGQDSADVDKAADALTRRLRSASIAVTAASTAARAATRPRTAADRPAIPSLARSACLMNAAVNARGRRTPNTTARPRIWFSSVTRWPTSFLRAMISDHRACAGSDLT